MTTNPTEARDLFVFHFLLKDQVERASDVALTSDIATSIPPVVPATAVLVSFRLRSLISSLVQCGVLLAI